MDHEDVFRGCSNRDRIGLPSSWQLAQNLSHELTQGLTHHSPKAAYFYIQKHTAQTLPGEDPCQESRQFGKR